MCGDRISGKFTPEQPGRTLAQRIDRILIAYIMGLFFAPLGALIGALLFSLAGGLAALVIGILVGSVFAAPVTGLVFPTMVAVWPRTRDLHTGIFVLAGAVAGALSTWLICRANYQLSRDIGAFVTMGMLAGAIVAKPYVYCAERWAR